MPLLLDLVPPATRYRATFLRGFAELRAEGLPWWVHGDIELAEQDFTAFVAKKRADAQPTAPGAVPKTHLWAIADGHFVGRLSIHHHLTEALRREGGHIGYDTVPSYRGRGVATEMLRLALPIARELGLTEVLLTCDDDNAASIRVIEKNGGALRETTPVGETGALKRYYAIALS